MVPTMKRRKPSEPTAAERLRKMGGWSGGSIGQAEALAGINVQNHEERRQLWSQFRHLFAGDSRALFAAVMEHCAKLTLARIDAGELCLLPSTHTQH